MTEQEHGSVAMGDSREAAVEAARKELLDWDFIVPSDIVAHVLAAASLVHWMERAENAEATLRAIVDRADNGELGTSKVQDMKRLALALLHKASIEVKK